MEGDDPPDTGFIPTRAGKMQAQMEELRNSMVHPHSRGENRGIGLDRLVAQGSSPLARGKSVCVSGIEELRGFIPTRAGKIMRPSRPSAAVKVHPHSRGENVVDVVGVS